MQKSGVGTLVVVDGSRKLKGLLTSRDVRFVAAEKQVAERMTPVDKLVVQSGAISLDEAERMMVDRKVKKLPLVDDDGRAGRAHHGQGYRGAEAVAVCHARRTGPPARRCGNRRQRRLPRASGRAHQSRCRRARHRHRPCPFGRDGKSARSVSRAIRRFRARGGQRGHRGRGEVSGRTRRQRDQGWHRTWRRLHDAAQYEFRRAAAAGARRMPDGGG